MRHSIALLALLSLAVVARSAAQAPAAQNTPEAFLTAYNQAMQAKDWPNALVDAQKLVSLSASSENLLLLANAQLHSGTGEQTLVTYDRALAAADQEKPALGQPDADWKENLAKIYIARGNTLLKLHRTAEAIEAYNHSAEFASNPGLAYFNLCAVLYNTGNTHDSAAACRQSLHADPSRADAWFILGSDLFADSSVDAKGKATVSDEARQALNKYLELAPDGPHAADTKAMLEMAGK